MNTIKKTKFIFMQGGNNTRIGNTLVWIESAYTWCKNNDFLFIFPQHQQVFDNIFDENIELFSESSVSFNEFGVNPIIETFKGVPKKLDSMTKEIEPNIFACELITNSLLFINFKGRVWEPSHDLVEYFRRFETVIINEPFPFLTGKREFGLLKPSIKTRKYFDKLQHQFNNGLISVHIRQGDYKHWNNGKYYRDDKFYNDLLKNLSIKFPNKSIKFMHNGEFTPVESNYSFSMAYDEFDQLTAEMTDFLTFATSSIIIGPLSTFTAQAKVIGDSFLDRKSHLFVIEPDDDIKSIIDKVTPYLA